MPSTRDTALKLVNSESLENTRISSSSIIGVQMPGLRNRCHNAHWHIGVGERLSTCLSSTCTGGNGDCQTGISSIWARCVPKGIRAHCRTARSWRGTSRSARLPCTPSAPM
jgi:hypothetical protein